MTKPAKHFERWTHADDEKLRMMWTHGVDAETIAEHLERTVATIKWRWWHLRLLDARDEMHETLAHETQIVLPLDENHEPPNDFQIRKSPIEMIERRWLWGLITIVRFKYAEH